jgi:ubiquinone/menaquinone biosynthesis C-methylase UbiE
MYRNDSFEMSEYPEEGGVYLISPPQQFPGGEEAYDEHIGGAHKENLMRWGRGAWQLLSFHATRAIETVLEVGAGGGTCSIGLIASAAGASMLITDTSPRFLGLIRSKLLASETPFDNVRFAALAGEDLRLVPNDSFDAIVIASALHHVTDWRVFLKDSARVLRAGGTLVIQEPCREGNLMMGMVLDVVLSPLWPTEAALSSSDAERVARCRDSIFFLANSHITKVGEDKHSFLASELSAAGSVAGFNRSLFYSNFHFCDLFGHDFSQQQGRCSFLSYLDSFLEMHHRVSTDGLAKLRKHMFPVLQRLDATFVAGDGVPLLGCMVFCKQ